MRIVSWLVGLAVVILLGLAALTYGPALLKPKNEETIWVAQPAAPPPPPPVAPQVAVAPPAPPKVKPVEIPSDDQVAEDAAAVGMTTLEPDEEPSEAPAP